MRSPAWRLVVDHLSERVDAAMERIVQIDCTDRERAELAGEVRGLRHAIEWPGEEATFILNSLAEKK